MDTNPIQAELEEIVQEATAKTAALIRQQDDYIRAIVLVEQLKAIGGPALASLRVSLCFYSATNTYGLNIYAEHTDPSALHFALSNFGATLTKRDYGIDTELWLLNDYTGLQIFMPKSALADVAEAA
jgi:hypothetical protein